ncbi:geranylgeranylglycerol-phosphate geranylgeranyltransferase [Halonotius terrestris]|uniref:Digeranylgeranylglyceryl phosphate synthase n=1 Tax=Halonotius terrestris TaxID=2487750 RepID=A0A8J8TC58_9EURY|nr:geranylgeranylglycerol-phosphate geranylgeranyltransferase [Halonotius terrestris]TQQ83085.1 geranylgeranylglycerol-phosphate geranylgeranyltransferase [Halonotius terrestris]
MASVSLPLRAAIELARPGNAVAAGVLTFTGAFVTGGVATGPAAVAAAVLATVAATAGGNAINDYFDREIDAVNQPDRPIPRGAITARGALGVSVACFGIATVAALTLPLVAIGIAVVNLLALIAYTEWFKGRPLVGNILVAYLTGSAFLFGGAALGEPLGAGVLFLLAAVATLTREIVKDVEDITGDRQEGLRTFPIVVGRKPALWVGVAVITVAVAASALPYLDDTFGLSYLIVVVPADAVMLWAALRSFRDPTASQRWLKRGMFLATAAFVVGRAAVVLG